MSNGKWESSLLTFLVVVVLATAVFGGERACSMIAHNATERYVACGRMCGARGVAAYVDTTEAVCVCGSSEVP